MTMMPPDYPSAPSYRRDQDAIWKDIRALWRRLKNRAGEIELPNPSQMIVRVTRYTTGTGSMVDVAGEFVPFGVFFTDRPAVATGCAVQTPAELADSAPLVTAGVAEWQQDESGAYIGARFWYAVRNYDGAEDAGLRIQHDITLLGIASRDKRVEPFFGGGD